MRIVWLVVLWGCGIGGGDEGTSLGDCTDGRDNDGDGLEDCEDPGCVASVDCAEDTETPGTGDWQQDLDGDGFSAAQDCDDLDASVFPGAWEQCDGVDNDCDGLVDEDDCGDEIYDGPVLMEAIEVDCNATEWWYYVDTVGWTSGGFVDIEQTGADPGWSEGHNIPSVDYDENQWWDRLERRLDHVENVGDQMTDVSTLYDCDVDRKATMTWAVSVWDVDNVRADCAVFGHDTSFFLDQGEYSSCLDWNG